MSRRCENCGFGLYAWGLSRPIMTCKNKAGSKGQYFVIWQKDTCDNYQPTGIAYDRRAEQLFGEFTYLNLPHLAEFRKRARKTILGTQYVKSHKKHRSI